MRKIELSKTGLMVPDIAIGCMNYCGKEEKEIEVLVKTAMEMGANFFDHADIYGGGESERKFASAINMNGELRSKMILQSKCAIVPHQRYDFSKEHILKSVDGTLQRLRTDYLDVLLLHRPDTLFDEEVAEAFAELKKSGKVRFFGVSNHNPMQMQLLEKITGEKLVANQLQFGVAHSEMIANGINVNMKTPSANVKDGAVLEYCRLTDTTIQAWGPVRGTVKGKTIFNDENCIDLLKKLEEVGNEYGLSKEAAAIAWILRHPANMQAILGTTNADRLKDYLTASGVKIDRQHWYDIYAAAGNNLP
ncbi:MAG: aldo/keto reductase [Clostridia bacterium]|nr:aldo/keto reductase [Clostridia bacterium]